MSVVSALEIKLMESESAQVIELIPKASAGTMRQAGWESFKLTRNSIQPQTARLDDRNLSNDWGGSFLDGRSSSCLQLFAGVDVTRDDSIQLFLRRAQMIANEFP